jgi:uncharacterized membrane protein YkoI
MKKRYTAVQLTAAFAISVVSLSAAEKKIQAKDLPAAVQKTVAEQSKGGTVKGYSTEVENGKKVYEAELNVNGHDRDISMDEEGNLLEVEEAVDLGSLPQAVRDGLTKAAGKGKLGTVESLTKQGRIVAYEAVVKNGLKKSEIQVGPEGQKLAHPE